MEDQMPKNLVLYDQVNADPQLRQAYAGKVIAVVDGVIVGEDESIFFGSFYKKMNRAYPNKHIIFADFSNEKPLERRVLDFTTSN